MIGAAWSSVVFTVWLFFAETPAASTPTLTQLREGVRPLVSARCGMCHSATSPKALPGALKVYDIDQVNWTERMTDTQVKNILQRFRGPAIPQAEVDRVTAFVDAELASRREKKQ
jgi:DNA-binding transcriptional regulator YdaS (Cro superfamily)